MKTQLNNYKYNFEYPYFFNATTWMCKAKPRVIDYNQANIKTYSKHKLTHRSKTRSIKGKGGFSHGRSHHQAYHNPFGVITRIYILNMPFRGYNHKEANPLTFSIPQPYKQGMAGRGPYTLPLFPSSLHERRLSPMRSNLWPFPTQPMKPNKKQSSR